MKVNDNHGYIDLAVNLLSLPDYAVEYVIVNISTWRARLRIHNLRVHRVCTQSEQQEQYFDPNSFENDDNQLEIF